MLASMLLLGCLLFWKSKGFGDARREEEMGRDKNCFLGRAKDGNRKLVLQDFAGLGGALHGIALAVMAFDL